MDCFKDLKKPVGELEMMEQRNQKDFYSIAVMLLHMENNMDHQVVIKHGNKKVVHVELQN
jgi:hypothetical protein